MRKVLCVVILLATFFVSKSFANEEINQKCLELGFKDGTPEIANCRLELLLLNKQTTLEQKKLQAAEAQARASRQQAAAAQATAAATQSIANSQAWRNNRTLMQSGQKMLSGGCTLGMDC
jgi:uncharacterized membrane protein YheB (UPF0754 family)|tara:strand:+ start:244 stop:603 length:360 start_codon:yes stop_codon:yes gene_type:complete